MSLEGQMLITAERDGYFGLRAKPALGSSVSIRGLNGHSRNVANGYTISMVACRCDVKLGT